MNIRPYGDRILIKRLEEEGKLASGLFVPDSAKEKPQAGEVLAVGDGKVNDEGKSIAIKVKVGDIVLFSKYSGSDVPKVYGDDHLLIREDEVLAVVDGGTKKAKA